MMQLVQPFSQFITEDITSLLAPVHTFVLVENFKTNNSHGNLRYAIFFITSQLIGTCYPSSYAMMHNLAVLDVWEELSLTGLLDAPFLEDLHVQHLLEI